MISLNIKNILFTHFAKLVNILDFNSKRLIVEKVESGETCIYFVKYDKDPFYLIIDDLKGYFEESNVNKYLTLIFKRSKAKNNV